MAGKSRPGRWVRTPRVYPEEEKLAKMRRIQVVRSDYPGPEVHAINEAEWLLYKDVVSDRRQLDSS